jgi:hypothetical protein
LPEPPADDLATHLLTLITDFSTEIKHCVQGSSGRHNLVQTNNGVFRDFKTAIGRTVPGFIAGLPIAENLTEPYILTDAEEGQGSAGSQIRPIYLTDVRETLVRHVLEI